MTKEELEAIKSLVLYSVLNEQKHYQETKPRDRKNHIYRTVMLLSKWYDKQMKEQMEALACEKEAFDFIFRSH